MREFTSPSFRAESDPAGDPIRIVTFTTLFPNAVLPTHGIFVENRLRHLVANRRVSGRVIAPVPWFPRSLAPLLPAYAKFADIPRSEIRHNFPVYHPRFPVLPKIGMSVAPALLFAGALPAFRRLQRESGDFDMIDAHYFYPDGVAAVMLGKVLGKPVVVTARGTDINLIPEHSLPRWLIRETARRASGIITVSQALHDRLVTIGVPASRIRVLRNGVDLEQFRPMDKAVSRTKLHLNGPTLLSVGQLVELKGHDIIIRSLALLPDYSLLIAGEGPDRSALESLAAKLGVGDRVRFLGRLAHEQLPEIYSAADALILASSREGLPNVLLESMACGTPVVATRVGGIPEVVVAPEAGVLMPERSENGVVTGVRALFGNLPDRADTRRYAAQFGWQETSEGQIRLFQEILGRAQGERRIETTVPEEIAPKDEGPRSPREDPLEDRMALRDIQR